MPRYSLSLKVAAEKKLEPIPLHTKDPLTSILMVSDYFWLGHHLCQTKILLNYKKEVELQKTGSVMKHTYISCLKLVFRKNYEQLSSIIIQ